MVVKILSYPLLQLFAFCILLVGSPYFGGPYIFFLYHGVQEILAYAVIGWMAAAMAVCAVFFSGRGAAVLQFISAILMFVSLVVFIFSSGHFMNIYVWRQFVPILTLLLFLGVMILVVRKFIKPGGV
ncbi:MAG TPA: hypothetical protein VG738_19620 [Chitinophagaceae bacterium]|nr:hypothetical protein [Chitinophagaceae bacterium]